MKRRSYILLNCLAVLLTAVPALSQAQCGSGYTSAMVNWDLQYFDNSKLPVSGIRFMIGVNSMRLTWSGTNTLNGVTGSHTGSGSSHGTGNDLKFSVGNGSDTLRFDNEVSNLRFSIYDLDNSQSLTVTAMNTAGVSQNITLAKVGGTLLTISGSGTATATAAAGSGTVSNSSTNGTANVTIAGPVKEVVLRFSKSTGTDSVFLSDLTACVYGNWPNSYLSNSGPQEGQDTLMLVSYSDSGIYVLNKTTRTATLLYKDPYIKEPNSLAFDSYNQVVYYCDGLNFSPSNKQVVRYQLRTGIRDTFIRDVTALGIQLFSAGLASSGAAFYNGSLFIGQEPYALSEPIAVWRIDMDSVSGQPIQASRVWAKPGYNSSGILYNWADFVIRDGVIYNFNSGAYAAANTTIEHISLNDQSVTQGYTYSGISQSAMDFLGNIYLMKAYNYALYNGSGGFGPATNYTGVTAGAAIVDAAEAFKYPYDFGDAPSSYGTAYHLYKQDPDLMIGSQIDYYVRGLNNNNATADDLHNTGALNDEDGASTFDILTTVSTAYTVSVLVTNNTGAPATLYGFIDTNIDGDFGDDQERSLPATVPPGTYYLNVNWSGMTGQAVGNTYIRFRLASSAAQAMQPSGYAATGEAEDYPLTVVGGALPVELISFSGNVQDNGSHLLCWATASERNNAYFDVQRSPDFVHWASIGQVAGHGNSQEPRSYVFTDWNPMDSLNYYRLKQVDLDGGFAYSPAIVLYTQGGTHSALGDKQPDLVLYPNPVKDVLWIRTDMDLQLPAGIDLYNLSGYRINSFSLKGQLQRIDLGTLPAGVYIIRAAGRNYKIYKE